MGIKHREFPASVGSVAGLAGLAAAVPAVATAAARSGQGAQSGAPLYKQAGAPADARVNDLLGRMTLEEKSHHAPVPVRLRPVVHPLRDCGAKAGPGALA